METTEPNSYLTTVHADGSVRETEMTTDQWREIEAGRPVGYYPHDEQVLVDDDGTVVHRQSAVPPDAA